MPSQPQLSNELRRKEKKQEGRGGEGREREGKGKGKEEWRWREGDLESCLPMDFFMSFFPTSSLPRETQWAQPKGLSTLEYGLGNKPSLPLSITAPFRVTSHMNNGCKSWAMACLHNYCPLNVLKMTPQDISKQLQFYGVSNFQGQIFYSIPVLGKPNSLGGKNVIGSNDRKTEFKNYFLIL